MKQTREKRTFNAIEREKQVLQMRLDGMTLQEIGKHFGVTRERIRQVETKGLERQKITQ